MRGNASQLYEKYQTLGRDTTASDRIIAENLLQHAEHYFRVMNAAGAAAAAASGEAEPRPRINGGDGQPIVEPVAAPAPAVAPDSRRDDSPPMITAASPRAENENAAAEAVEDVAAPPVPDTPIDDPAPKKATAKPRRRTKNIDTAAKTAKENAVEPADDDQELAS